MLLISSYIQNIYNSFPNLDEVETNVSAATQHVNNISSQSNKIKLKLRNKKEEGLYPSETNIALKQTAENLLKLVISTTKKKVDEFQVEASPTPFLEFVSFFFDYFFKYRLTWIFFKKSEAEKRINENEDVLTSLGCIVDADNNF